MESSNYLICPKCNQKTDFMAKYEATYIYSYLIASNSPGRKNSEFLYPYLYDKRELTNHNQYLECCTCREKYDFNFNIDSNRGISKDELKEVLEEQIEYQHV